jgi:hypothetical protein
MVCLLVQFGPKKGTLNIIRPSSPFSNQISIYPRWILKEPFVHRERNYEFQLGDF